MIKGNEQKIFIGLTAILSFIGLMIVLLILNNAKAEQIEQSQHLVVQEATAHYTMIKEMEIWHNKFGGVFKEGINNDDYHFNIYSLKPKNEQNHAVGFVRNALINLKKNPKQSLYYRFSPDNRQFDFVGVLYTQPKCITCHSNFVVGELRGGIEITLPLTKYHDALETIKRQFHIFYFMVIGVYLFGLGLLLYFIHNIFNNKEKIEELNSSLEKKVKERTKEVQVLYTREHYLKRLLETITELNESLISTYSLGSIIETSLETLKHHPNYKIILFGHFDGEVFHQRYISGDIYGIFTKEHISLEELGNYPNYCSIHNAVINRHWNIQNPCLIELPFRNRSRHEDYELSASIAFPLIEDDKSGLDILTFWTNREEGFDEEEINILDTVVHDITMALSAYKQRKMNEHLQKEQINNYEETILAFVDMIEQRDAYTAGHTLRVAKYSRKLATYLKIDEVMIHKIEKAAILHDIGKIATPDTILLKPGRLNALEYELIKNHVTAGYKMLSKVKMYAELAEIMKFHHEHYDGRGYPYGLKGDEIPMEAHIMMVADAFDAMTTNRIYKGRLTVQDAISELNKKSGIQFHPSVVDAANHVLVDEVILQTTQMPQSDLEKQRFSYFFNDNLTGLYNEGYLQLMLHQIDTQLYVYIVRLHNITTFNKHMSWNKGNELLLSVANQLKEYFPEAKIFRFEGDDFLILSSILTFFEENMINLKDNDPESIVTVEVESMLIRDSDDVHQLEPYII
ncbi:MAG: HD domain-containing protein [Sulfuricurvum sp.]|uniref:HD domain-containing phosphohydrolase n=1 Tax=Sulfuricurvum sp. TaxID=2025608 RepID=UPI002625E95A|nr:HD domain-containing phosphohydrolase [Sulfuricurvum sp.]MDD2830199.1 HD domain-containing protein [Sulfuricurvum sp.]MDD4949565.1 HD domain-containing protein [Sulfuricurvum sp.]